MRFIHSLYIASGILYLAMPAMVWVLLRQRHPMRPLALWCAGGVLLPLGSVLLGLRSFVPDPTLVFYPASAAIYGACALQLAALRIEAQQPPQLPRLLLAGAVAIALLVLVEHQLGAAAQRALENLLAPLFWLALAVTARALARLRGSRSARLLAGLYVVMALSVLARFVQRALALPHDLAPGPEVMFTLTVVFLLAASIAVNIAYVGLALDRAREGERGQRHALQALHRQQLALAAAARGREVVAGERARTTRLLAHEVRQPLHNAAVSLQQALATLTQSDDRQAAIGAIEQAQGVIRAVSTTLDNTVAATALLSGPQRAHAIDSDLPLLLELALGDLAPQAQQRVHIDYRADARSVQLEPTLVRLALRNLLANATLYSPPASPVLLRVLDSDEPLALVIEVVDEGPGIPVELREQIFEEGQRGDQPTVPGHGLGLHVVRRVAQLHGGQIAYEPNSPRGSIFRLTLPQADPG